MPNLSWLGKDKVVTYHQKVAYHFLDKKFSIGNSDNAIIHGDNLIALKSLLPRYENKIKCIYIDPPYNTGNENWIYNDNVSDSRLQKWLGQVVGKEGEDLTRHDKWLCMMYPRLRLLQKLLSDDGAIFISIDDNELFYLKCICDEIFGASNFVANFVCKSKQGKVGTSATISNEHEYIICYAKNFTNLKFKMVVKKSEGRKENLRQWGQADKREDRPTMFYPIKIDGVEILPIKDDGTEGRWRVSEKMAQELLKNNQLEAVNKNGHWNIYRKFSAGETSTPYGTWIENIGTTAKGTIALKNLGLNFAYPKPVELLEFIFNLATDKNSIVLDSFAGSGTTAHAVINLNKQDGGNRKFILIELNDYAENITAERVKRVGGEFNFYEIGAPLFDEDDFINSAVPFERICEYIYFSETRKNYQPCEEKNLLGVDDDTAYYYFGGENLSWTTLSKIKTRAKVYVIYADACNLSEDEMQKYNIHFRQIPFDVRRY